MCEGNTKTLIRTFSEMRRYLPRSFVFKSRWNILLSTCKARRLLALVQSRTWPGSYTSGKLKVTNQGKLTLSVCENSTGTSLSSPASTSPAPS